MDYRKFGNTGIEVSEIGFGCGDVGGLMVRGEHADPSSYTHLRAHETREDLVCRLLLET